VSTVLGPRFVQALGYAASVHHVQRRKGPKQLPYISHLLLVTALVIEEGGSEDEAIAALLHDAAEDQGGERRLAEIESLFGSGVATIVRECSDSLTEDPDAKDDWRVRKAAYIEHLEAASPGALRVSLADKVHNARSILRDLQQEGNAVWQRFAVEDPHQQLEYYEALADRFERLVPGWLAQELSRAVGEIRSVVERPRDV